MTILRLRILYNAIEFIITKFRSDAIKVVVFQLNIILSKCLKALNKVYLSKPQRIL